MTTTEMYEVGTRLLAGERVTLHRARADITGHLSKRKEIRGKYRVKTKADGDGWLTWLEPKGDYVPKETHMDNFIPPNTPQGWSPNTSKWGPALEALINGKVIRMEAKKSTDVVPFFSRAWVVRQGYIVRSRMEDGSVVVWMEHR